MRPLAVSVLLLLASVTVRANLDLTVKTKETAAKGVQVLADSPTQETLHVTLGPNWFRYDDGETTAVYDFARRRAVMVDDAKHTYTDFPLIAHVAGSEYELQNRLYLDKMLEAGGAAGPHGATKAEHQLSLRGDAAAPSGIQSSTKKDERRFVWKRAEMMVWSTEVIAARASDRDQFVRFFRYRFGSHPEILDALQHTDGIPKWFRYSDLLMGQTRIDVIPAGDATADTPPPSLPTDAKEEIADPALTAIVAKVRLSTPQSRTAAAEAIRRTANEAMDANHPLEAELGYIELYLMTGIQPPEIAAHRDAFSADPDARTLMAALSPKSEAEAKTAVATLTRVQSAAGAKAYVVGIFRADIETKLGDSKAAVTDFIAALYKNPLITGVWKDLGDIDRSAFNATAAWRSYETARLIAPDHPMLREITSLEERLMKGHPEYF